MQDLNSLQERIIQRASIMEKRIASAIDEQTSGPPVGGSTRPRADTNLLYQVKDPRFLTRIQSMAPYLTPEEKASENRRSQIAGGYKVFEGT